MVKLFMNDPDKINGLVAEIKKTLSLVDKNKVFFDNFQENEFPLLKEGTSSAMILSQIVTDFYTCIETLFHRISQFFGNGIKQNSWHKNLLANMVLEIPAERERVISDITASVLDELLRFRHFRRYYFDTEYDWDKIKFIEKKYLQAIKLIRVDLNNFEKFLKLLQEDE